MKEVNISRDELLLSKIVLVDGLPGNGKTLFSSIIPSFTNVELLSYSDEIEAVCEIYYLNKISLDVTVPLLRMMADLRLYNQSMGRNVNFRTTDLSSALKYPDKIEYINRLFLPGDEHIISVIEGNKPILHLATHNKLGYSEPLWEAFSEKIYFLEILRHPAYMIKQIGSVLMEDLVNNVRNWSTQFEYNGYSVPYFSIGWEEEYLSGNPTERAVKFIDNYSDRVNKFKKQNPKYLPQVLTIPFEPFVLNPDQYIFEILNFMDVEKTNFTKNVLMEQKIPRSKVSDSIELEIYKRCGWSKPIEAMTEADELKIRKQWVKDKVSKESYELFNNLCDRYEKKVWRP